MSNRFLTFAAILSLAAGAFAEVRWGQVELAFFRVRGDDGRMIELPTKGVVLPVRMERITANRYPNLIGKHDIPRDDVFPSAQTVYSNDRGTNYFYDPSTPSSLDDINILPSGNGQWWYDLTIGCHSEFGNAAKVMNRQLGWTTYVQGRGAGIQAFDNLVFDVGWVFLAGNFPPGDWKFTVPIHNYWAQIPAWNMPRVPSGLIYFAQEWRAYDTQGNGAFLTGNFAPMFSGDGDPTVGFSGDNFWSDWDPVPDGIFSEDEFDYFGGPPNEANFLMTLTTQQTGVVDTVRPTSVQIVRGKNTGGNVGSFHFVDQNYYKVNKFIVLNLFEPAIQFTIDGFSPANNLTAISADVVAKTNTVGLQQTIYLFNFATNQYVQLDQRAATTTDTRYTIGAPGNAPDYVDIPSGNVVRMKITYKQTGPTAIFAWGCSVDLANWLVTHP